MPITFSFDLTDANFIKEIQNFCSFFNFVKISNELIFNGKAISHQEIEFKHLIETAESNLMDNWKGKTNKNQKGVFSNKINKIKKIIPEEKNDFDIQEDKNVQNSIENQPNKNNEPLKDQKNHFSLDFSQKIVGLIKYPKFSIDNFTQNLLKIRQEDQFKIDYSKIKLNNALSTGNNIWISKVAGLNRGLGIEIFSSLDELKKVIMNLHTGYQEKIIQNKHKISRSKIVIKADKFVIQKYIERPLLFEDRKMDIRVWVLMTHEMKIHVFQECYFRLSSEKYTINNLQEKFVHLTNNALQKYSENFDADETLKSIDQFDHFIRESAKVEYNFRRDSFPVIKEHIKLVGKIAENKINFNNKKLTFEIFGFDFMMDTNFGVWLIEVNSNPSITTPGTLLKAYVPRMLDDAFKITIDKVFPGPFLEQNERESFPIQGYEDDYNMWELII